MFVKERSNGHLVEVLSLNDLFNPYQKEITGRYQVGEELQEAERFLKSDLSFMSDEQFPACWSDPHYREHELRPTLPGTGTATPSASSEFRYYGA